MPPKRGARPRGPRPWPQRAEEHRQDMHDAAGEILTLVTRVYDPDKGILPDTNIYLTERALAQIKEMARYIQNLALEARLLGDDGEGADIAELVREEVARQLAERGEPQPGQDGARPILFRRAAE